MLDRSMRHSFSRERAIDLLEQADVILAEGGLEADVCRQLGVSHVVYERLRSRYQHPDFGSEEGG